MSKILIVDDNPDILLSVEATLLTGGHEVIATSEPRQVASLLNKNAVDAMVLDVMMPDISGLEVLETVRARPRGKTLPVLLLSALGETDDLVRGLRGGADDYLVKPFKPLELLARVERLISRRSEGAGLAGSLESFSPGDVLQNLTQGNKTGCLELSAERDVAEVWIRSGHIVGAKIGKLRGQSAILAILELKSGVFNFEARDVAAAELEEGAGRLPLSSLLLEAAWLEDELAKRAADLPALEASLIAVAPLPTEFPEEFAELPFKAVHDEISRCPGVDRQSLIAQEMASLSQVLLALALLIEQGVIDRVGAKLTAEASVQGADEVAGLDALSQLVAVCEQRGIGPGESIHLLMLFQADAWQELLTLVKSISDDVLTMHCQQALLEQLGRRRSGAVRLSYDHQTVFLHLQPLRRKDKFQGEWILPLMAGVVVWLTDEVWDADLIPFVTKIEQLAPRSATVALLPDRTLLGSANASLAALHRCRASASVPRSFSDLVQLFDSKTE